LGYTAKQRILNRGISNDQKALKEIFKVLRHQGNANQNNSGIPFYTNQNGYDQNLEIARAGEDGEQGKHAFIACSIANLYNHFGNQFGSFSENLE
jgi:hypothetical protein